MFIPLIFFPSNPTPPPPTPQKTNLVGSRIATYLVGKDAANGRQELHESADMAGGRREVDQRPVPAHNCRHGAAAAAGQWTRPSEFGPSYSGDVVLKPALPLHERGVMLVRPAAQPLSRRLPSRKPRSRRLGTKRKKKNCEEWASGVVSLSARRFPYSIGPAETS